MYTVDVYKFYVPRVNVYRLRCPLLMTPTVHFKTKTKIKTKTKCPTDPTCYVFEKQI